MKAGYTYTTPVKVLNDPMRGGTGLSSITYDGTSNTMQTAGQVTDYAANDMVIGSAENTTADSNGNPSTGNWAGPVSGWSTSSWRIQTISDGSSNTILVGTKALATQVYNQRGCSSYTMTNGSTRSCDDDPITASGPGVNGLVRAQSPDTLWWLAAKPGSGNDSGQRIAGNSWPMDVNQTWVQYTFGVVKDAPDLDAFNKWGSPYISGGLFGMADGSVRSVSYSVPYTLIIALCTPAGGEVISGDY